ncbi:MAG: hypothetical protein WAL79_11490, partial [Nitrososphaeraceae archaeon]
LWPYFFDRVRYFILGLIGFGDPTISASHRTKPTLIICLARMTIYSYYCGQTRIISRGTSAMCGMVCDGRFSLPAGFQWILPVTYVVDFGNHRIQNLTAMASLLHDGDTVGSDVRYHTP